MSKKIFDYFDKISCTKIQTLIYRSYTFVSCINCLKHHNLEKIILGQKIFDANYHFSFLSKYQHKYSKRTELGKNDRSFYGGNEYIVICFWNLLNRQNSGKMLRRDQIHSFEIAWKKLWRFSQIKCQVLLRKQNLPVDKSTFGIHQVKFVIQARPGFGNGGGVGQHAHGTVDLKF